MNEPFPGDSSLVHFLTIVEKGSFSEAAKALYISQPALSQQIRTLEKQLGFDLFVHGARRMVLTEAGKAFYPRARQIVSTFTLAVQDARFIDQGHRTAASCLRIGCLGEEIFVTWHPLLGLCREVMDRYSPVCMRFPDRSQLYAAIAHGEADLAFHPENADIRAFGLQFLPVVTLPELFLPFYMDPESLPEVLQLEDLLRYRIAFHHEDGYCLYEDSLRRELTGSLRLASLLEPSDFFSAPFGIPTLLAVPRLTVNLAPSSKAVPLSWGEGIRAGFVFATEPDPKVREFAIRVRSTIRSEGNPWG